jgi:hypothetical protein
VLAPAGAILPLVADREMPWGTPNPDALELRVYAGADGEFVLAEDSADDSAEDAGDGDRWAQTRFTFSAGELRIHPVDGAREAVPVQRRYDVVLCGFTQVGGAEVNGTAVAVGPGPVPGSVSVRLPAVTADEGAVLRLAGDLAPAGNTDVPERLFTLLDRAQLELATKEAVHRVLTTHAPLAAVLALAALDLHRPLLDALVELLLAEGD